MSDPLAKPLLAKPLRCPSCGHRARKEVVCGYCGNDGPRRVEAALWLLALTVVGLGGWVGYSFCPMCLNHDTFERISGAIGGVMTAAGVCVVVFGLCTALGWIVRNLFGRGKS